MKQKTTASQTLWALDPCWNRLNFAPLCSIYSTAAHLEAQMHLDIITKPKECLALRIAQSIFRSTVNLKARLELGWCTEQEVWGGGTTKKRLFCVSKLSVSEKEDVDFFFLFKKLICIFFPTPSKTNKQKNNKPQTFILAKMCTEALLVKMLSQIKVIHPLQSVS